MAVTGHAHPMQPHEALQRKGDTAVGQCFYFTRHVTGDLVGSPSTEAATDAAAEAAVVRHQCFGTVRMSNLKPRTLQLAHRAASEFRIWQLRLLRKQACPKSTIYIQVNALKQLVHICKHTATESAWATAVFMPHTTCPARTDLWPGSSAPKGRSRTG